jgi:hypothetical protein
MPLAISYTLAAQNDVTNTVAKVNENTLTSFTG